MKKTIITLLQILATLGILAWLFRNPEMNRNMWEALSHAQLGWIVAAIGVFAGIEVFAIARWHVLLKVQGITISRMRIAALMMIGLFFNIFMPGGTGGDVAKVFYLLKETPGKEPAALLAVLMDRIIGLLAVIVLAGAVFIFRYDWLTQTPATSGLLWGLLFLFVGSIVSVGGAFLVTTMGWMHKLPQRLPMRDKLVELCTAYHAYGKAWRSSLAAFLLSIPVHLLSFALAYFVAHAFVDAAKKISLYDCMAIMPIINTLTAIPVTIGGAGAREVLFCQLFGDLCGVSEKTAMVVSLTTYTVMVLWGIAGGLVYIFYRSSKIATAATAPLSSSTEPTPTSLAEGELK